MPCLKAFIITAESRIFRWNGYKRKLPEQTDGVGYGQKINRGYGLRYNNMCFLLIFRHKKADDIFKTNNKLRIASA